MSDPHNQREYPIHSPDRPPLLMFVDDNEVLLSSMGYFLELEGFEVMLAEDGVDALNQLKAAQHLPDLIISDIAMPNMDGFELFEAIRANDEWISIQFLFLTARDQEEDLSRGYALGADDYLLKPFNQDRLLMVIRNKLLRRQEWMTHLKSQQEALEKAKNTLSMMVSHELRTPLVSMNIVSDMLFEEIDNMEPEQVRGLLDSMQSGSVRLTRLVEQMVMYVQVKSGALLDSLQQYFRPRSMAEAVEGAIKQARLFDYRRRDIPLHTENPGYDVQINCDLNSLQHALAELILNAISFSPPTGSVMIRQMIQNGYVALVVCDEGKGIPDHELARVFDAFYQVDRAKNEQQGIGIGLTLAKDIIGAHHGTVRIESGVGRGTEVHVRLPIHKQERGSDES